jgi:hypothetical protein
MDVISALNCFITFSLVWRVIICLDCVNIALLSLYRMKYRDNPPVLKGVSFITNPGERIGVSVDLLILTTSCDA